MERLQCLQVGVIGLTECLAREGRPADIRVNAISPGPTNTAMRERIFPGDDPSRRQPPEAVTEAILWLIADQESHLHGQSLDLRPWTRGTTQKLPRQPNAPHTTADGWRTGQTSEGRP